jgi:hypothetical protein
MDFKFKSVAWQKMAKRIMNKIYKGRSIAGWEVLCSFLEIRGDLSFKLSRLEVRIAREAGGDFASFVRVAFEERVKKAEDDWLRCYYWVKAHPRNSITLMFNIAITLTFSHFLSL